MKIPWWIKILVGGLGVGVIVTKTPIVPIMQLFFLIVMIPLGLFASVGLIGDGTLQFVNQYGSDAIKRVREGASEVRGRIDEEVERRRHVEVKDPNQPPPLPGAQPGLRPSA